MDRYVVPQTTLSRCVKENWTSMPQHGNDTALTAAEEDGIVEMVLFRCKRGMCMPPDELRDLAYQVAVATQYDVPESFPGRGWLEGFWVAMRTRSPCASHRS